MFAWLKKLVGIGITLRTDLQVVQQPAVVPFSGDFGRNAQQKDPDFNTRIARLTDASLNMRAALLTGDSGGEGIWNTNDQMIAVRVSGGASLALQFNPSKMTAGGVLKKFTGDGVCFSRVQPGVLYELDGTIVWQHRFAKINGFWVYQTRTSVVDFAAILPPGLKIRWSGTFLVSQDDMEITVGFSDGVQNTGIYCCTFRRGSGLRMLNTQSGVVSGDWGEVGQIRLVSPDTKVPFTMHECSQTPNPDFAQIGAFKGGSSPLIWQIPTLDVRDSVVTGHGAKGYQARFAGGPGGGQLKEVPYLNPSFTTLVVAPQNLPSNQTPPQKYDGDSHFGFGLVKDDDSSIIWASGQTDISPFTSAWMNEVRGYDVIKGCVYRACHTWNSGKNPYFIVANAIAIPSQTGKYVAFASDMMGGLGLDGKGNPRGDVFVAKVA